MRSPDLTQMHVVPIVVSIPDSQELRYMLPPTGYLLGVAVNPSRYTELECHLEHYNTQAIEGTKFYVRMAMTSGGIWFEQPMPNASTVDPYILVMKTAESYPLLTDLIIYPVGCWEKNS